MAQTITIRIDNGSEGGDGGGTTGIASGGGLPTPVFSGMASGADQSAMAAPTPLDAGGQAAQADMQAPAPLPGLFSGGNAVSADLPTPFSGGAAGMAPASGGAMSVPMPTDSMVPGAPGASGDQAPMPSPDMQPDVTASGGSPSEEGTGRKARK